MVYAAIAAGLFAGDFFLKRKIDKTRRCGEDTEICQGRIIIRKYYNSGAALNFMQSRPGALRLVCGGLLLGLGILWYLLVRNKRNPGLSLGLSLILGGGASNLWDRLTKGHVVDYFSFRTPWKRLNRIVFNLSDLFIFLGGIVLLVFCGRDGK